MPSMPTRCRQCLHDTGNAHWTPALPTRYCLSMPTLYCHCPHDIITAHTIPTMPTRFRQYTHDPGTAHTILSVTAHTILSVTAQTILSLPTRYRQCLHDTGNAHTILPVAAHTVPSLQSQYRQCPHDTHNAHTLPEMPTRCRRLTSTNVSDQTPSLCFWHSSSNRCHNWLSQRFCSVLPTLLVT